MSDSPASLPVPNPTRAAYIAGAGFGLVCLLGGVSVGSFVSRPAKRPEGAAVVTINSKGAIVAEVFDGGQAYYPPGSSCDAAMVALGEAVKAQRAAAAPVALPAPAETNAAKR